MTFVTSKKSSLPKTAEELQNDVWFNMWTKRYWPYQEVESGDTLFWYESPNKRVVWQSTILDVIRFAYQNKEEAQAQLGLSPDQAGHFYFANAPASGFCLQYKVEAIARLPISKPEAFRFPQLGWLHVDEKVQREWPELAAQV